MLSLPTEIGTPTSKAWALSSPKIASVPLMNSSWVSLLLSDNVNLPQGIYTIYTTAGSWNITSLDKLLELEIRVPPVNHFLKLITTNTKSELVYENNQGKYNPSLVCGL